ncbi:IS110 family transposase [Luteimonas suaedae]|uniref:IS110 family transposase n=1 Tax=Luteimonas suaedae TaxID=2605430 RepID=UPI0011EDDEB7|nr:transposase [Luteimonas suaedae]
MAQRAIPAELAFDIGAGKHAFAFAFACAAQSEQGEVRNDPDELRTFLTARLRCGRPLRVLVEATGIYYLDLALLAVELGAEVMVVNPKAAHNFAKALQRRNKTDRLDAAMLLQFLQRMPFTPWTPPARVRLELRHYGRYLTQLTEDGTAAKNRLHALTSTQASPKALRQDLQRALASLEQRIARIRQQALALIQTDAELHAAFRA